MTLVVWHFWEIVGLLADLEAQAGHEETAAVLRRDARIILDEIIDHMPEGELRISFAGLPTVQSILSDF